ncbi:NAD-glutamate dehydrogenase [Gordonia soli]|uniref:NAD-dependent glutamate dehydrogenase n=1 Tax=Gordonia soli NBRC 108243 TaxID=1223545 RepID=M0QK99_9ACTN|nr:NAD-glutamate dehydrogenase [Gordonia soli]GAC69070.1 NAD-dependent glutamate dehydrogenase [Gordonia soli NBRC 108243]
MTDVTSLLPQAIPYYFSGQPNRTPAPAGSVGVDDLDTEDLDRITRHLEVAATRTSGEAALDVITTGSGGVEVVVVNDDMPLLVEAVLATVESYELSVSRIDHPILSVVRGADGELSRVGTLTAVDAQASVGGWAPPGDREIADPLGSEVHTDESWIYVVCLSRQPDTDTAALRLELDDVIRRVADVARDGDAMRDQMATLADECADPVRGAAAGVGATDRYEYSRLLHWFAGNHFLPLGYTRVATDDSGASAQSVGQAHAATNGAAGYADVRLGVWRTDDVRAEFPQQSETVLLPTVSRVHLVTGIQRSEYPTLIRIPAFDADGSRIGEHRFVGTFTSSGLHQTVLDVPVLRSKVADVLHRSGAEEKSYVGQSMIELLQNYPIVEMFANSEAELSRRIDEMLDAVATRSLRVFLRVDADGETASALVYLPRDRYTTRSRLTLQDELARYVGGGGVEYTARVSEMPLALLQVLIHVEPAAARSLGSVATGGEHQDELQRILAETIRSWDERVRELARAGGESGTGLPENGLDGILRLLPGLSDEYKELRTPDAALADLVHIAPLGPGDVTVRFRAADGGYRAHIVDHTGVDVPSRAQWIFTLYLCGESATLTDVLPVLHSLGLDVLEEHPYQLTRADGDPCWAYDFGVTLADGMSVDESALDDLETRFTEAFSRIWGGEAEVDAFNELVIRCGLDWRSAAMLRAYSRYLRQCGFSYSTGHVASVLGTHGSVTRGLVELFRASFDPEVADEARRDAVLDSVREEIGAIISLDADRVVSAFASVIAATSRVNYFVDGTEGSGNRPVMSFKLRPREIPLTPQPRPLHEIFVYSPRIEGVHLRFGQVARGGLRWSDRREDFRTEILGLVKAQAVKNAVIVPLGAKGGFVVKRPPTPTGDVAADRDAHRAEGIACYRQFIAGLLDVTDNIDRETGAVIPARSVVRRDADDTYLVVAADKGTASFSDIANAVSVDYGFWLGDAFASGGSAGYDHKAMGITARGAWESVKRHFREIGVDTQSEDFTVVGVGDMSGDVFGNGMLLSEHIRLVAAFDHRHVFIDPDPDAARSITERRRLFELPRSSWADYDTELISSGGGVWPRDQKSIPISAEIRAALGLQPEVTELAPPELIRSILLAPVDLLWNGGIGTYVKASDESDADVGDKANDAIRVNGKSLRVKVIGEGGNLGVTERGRVEFDLAGGRVNTDALDNSAGVDCSDHEVNIKILLDSAVSASELAETERTPLLESMTDEVADLVLADNISQNSELGFSRTFALERVEVHARLLRELERSGVDLELEALPAPNELRKRVDGDMHRGLTSPELATLMAHVKLAAKSELLASDLPDNDVFDRRLADYFPVPVRDRFAGGIATHRLRRQIVATTLVNDVVDRAGTTHLFRLQEGSGATTEEGVRAFVVAGQVFGLPDLFDRITHAPATVRGVDEMMLYARRLMFRASRWLLGFRPQPLAMAAEITRYTQRVTTLSTRIDDWLGEASTRDVADRRARYEAHGAPTELAHEVAVSLHRFCLFDIIDAAEIADRDAAEVGELYFAVMERFGLEPLLTAVSDLDYGDRWHALARLALRDDMHGALRALTLKILEDGEPEESATEKIAEWESSHSSRLARVRGTLDEIHESGTLDLATLSVAARQLRSVIR